MSLWEKIKQTFRSFMSGRHGIDQLSTALLWGGLVLYLIDLFVGTGILSLVAMAGYIFSLFRAFSRNNVQRDMENRRFVAWTQRISRSFQQAKARFANRKEYKYFRCPNCKGWIRLKRNTGEVTVTCSRCHHTFQEKA